MIRGESKNEFCYLPLSGLSTSRMATSWADIAKLHSTSGAVSNRVPEADPNVLVGYVPIDDDRRLDIVRITDPLTSVVDIDRAVVDPSKSIYTLVDGTKFYIDSGMFSAEPWVGKHTFYSPDGEPVEEHEYSSSGKLTYVTLILKRTPKTKNLADRFRW